MSLSAHFGVVGGVKTCCRVHRSQTREDVLPAWLNKVRDAAGVSIILLMIRLFTKSEVKCIRLPILLCGDTF